MSISLKAVEEKWLTKAQEQAILMYEKMNQREDDWPG